MSPYIVSTWGYFKKKWLRGGRQLWIPCVGGSKLFLSGTISIYISRWYPRSHFPGIALGWDAAEITSAQGLHSLLRHTPYSSTEIQCKNVL